MAINKIVYAGNSLIDLTDDTVTSDKLAEGITAHDKSGNKITGTMSSGGSATVCDKKDVNFYDYDGVLLYSYYIDEIQNLEELPTLPSKDHLVCQGWNYTLDQIKNENSSLNIGALYTTDNNNTRIHIELIDGRLSIYISFTYIGNCKIEWGDETYTELDYKSSSYRGNITHDYVNPGNYTIEISEYTKLIFDGASRYTYLIRDLTGNHKSNLAISYKSIVKEINLGQNVEIHNYAFSYLYSLEKISIPNDISVNSSGHLLYCCYSLKCAILPNNLKLESNFFYDCYNLTTISFTLSSTYIPSYAFCYCYNLKNIILPSTSEIDTLSSNCFNNCRSLTKIVIPKTVSTISSYSFAYCYFVKYYDFSNHESIPTLSNTNAFTNISSDCNIIVPNILLDSWKSATNWSTYANYIVGV